jgi:putative transcriptional regulator
VLDEKEIKQTWMADKLRKSYDMINRYMQNWQEPSFEILFEIPKIRQIGVKELLKSNKEI